MARRGRAEPISNPELLSSNLGSSPPQMLPLPFTWAFRECPVSVCSVLGTVPGPGDTVADET